MSEFSTTITGINGGETETNLSMRLKELVAAVADTGKKGSLTLKLSIERNKKNVKLLEVTAEIKAAIPGPPPPAAAFLLHEGELISLEDNQLKLPGMETRRHLEVAAAAQEPGYVFEEVKEPTQEDWAAARQFASEGASNG